MSRAGSSGPGLAGTGTGSQSNTNQSTGANASVNANATAPAAAGGGQRAGVVQYMSRVLGTMCHGVRTGAQVAAQARAVPPGQVPAKMSAAEFREQTKLGAFKGRGLLAGVDAAFAAYEAARNKGSVKPGNLAASLAALQALQGQLEAYLAMDKEHDPARQAATEALLAQVREENAILSLLTDAMKRVPADVPGAFELIHAAQDKQVALIAQGYLPSFSVEQGVPVANMDDFLKAVAGQLQGGSKAQALWSDINSLQALARDPRLPDITREILNREVLANLGSVHLELLKPGARPAGPDDPLGHDYVVNHSLSPALGTPERLGSLAHELTHVAISETYHNSDLFLELPANATEQEMKDLSKRRTEALTGLLQTLAQDPRFTPDQRKLLETKLNYPIAGHSGQIERYLGQIGNVDPELKQKLATLAANHEINNSLIESGTVVNQMLIYMALWNVPQSDPFYQELVEVGTEAFTERQSYRDRP